MLASDYVVTQAMWGQRLKARWHLSTWVASHVDTWVHKQARHIDRWESCKHSRDVGMWAREHRSHVGTWACKHARQVSTQDTLAREHISTQGTWACFQDAEHAIEQTPGSWASLEYQSTNKIICIIRTYLRVILIDTNLTTQFSFDELLHDIITPQKCVPLWEF